jgi:hypothetical protein
VSYSRSERGPEVRPERPEQRRVVLEEKRDTEGRVQISEAQPSLGRYPSQNQTRGLRYWTLNFGQRLNPRSVR